MPWLKSQAALPFSHNLRENMDSHFFQKVLAKWNVNSLVQGLNFGLPFHVGCVVFYGISTIMGYLMPNPVYTK